MNVCELLGLADREAGFLTEENNHCAAAIMRALAEALRDRRRGEIDANTRTMNVASGLGT